MSGALQGILLLLTVAVIFVNGWTDAPNAIASAVSTKAISYRLAVRLAAVCNLLGLVMMSFVNTSVAGTITLLLRFDSRNPDGWVAAICAAMITIVVFAVAAWVFGIPTSESHALIAALSGAGLAMGGGVAPSAWGKVILGLVISMGLGALLGYLLTALLRDSLGRCRPKTLDRLQIAAAGGMAFMHGAQDGQKFLAILVMVDLLVKGRVHTGTIVVREHGLALLLCAVVMALGTSVGGKRIIETVGGKMARLDKYQGVAADLASGLCLLLASLTGIPMSTTHTKTTAMMGAGLAGNRRGLDHRVIQGMITAWVITFPVCGALGFFLTKLLCML